MSNSAVAKNRVIIQPHSGSQGFTLIELLVVIAIIGILASVVLASLNSARSKAQDAGKIAAAKEIQKALEIYHADHGSYPSTGSAWEAGSTVCGAYGAGNSYSGATGYIPNLAPAYISVLPEVSNLGPNRCFLYFSNGSEYKLLLLGAIENMNTGSSLADPGYGGNPPTCNNAGRANTYAFYSSGGKCF